MTDEPDFLALLDGALAETAQAKAALTPDQLEDRLHARRRNRAAAARYLLTNGTPADRRTVARIVFFVEAA